MIHANNTNIDHAAHGRLGAGAKTPEGLARSAQNATRHGLSAQTFCLLYNEDANLFHKLKADLMSSLTPRNALELIHVEKIIESTWLLYRVSDLETKILTTEIEVQRANRAEQFKSITGPAAIEIREANLTFFALEVLETQNKTFQNLARYRTMHERSLHRAQNALAKMRGGATALATNIWPEMNVPEADTKHHHFREPEKSEKPAILQNEAPPPNTPNEIIVSDLRPPPVLPDSDPTPQTPSDFTLKE